MNLTNQDKKNAEEYALKILPHSMGDEFVGTSPQVLVRVLAISAERVTLREAFEAACELKNKEKEAELKEFGEWLFKNRYSNAGLLNGRMVFRKMDFDGKYQGDQYSMDELLTLWKEQK